MSQRQVPFFMCFATNTHVILRFVANIAVVPAKLIPANIANYVNKNFKGATIVKIDKEHYGYEVELSNGLDLKFNCNGSFMMIDD